jgi:hypothetical protein
VPGAQPPVPPETWTIRFYPTAGVIHDRADGWRKISKSSLQAYQQAVAEMAPFGASSNNVLPEQTRHAAPPTGGDGRTITVPILAVVLLGPLALACVVIGAWRLGWPRRPRSRLPHGRSGNG